MGDLWSEIKINRIFHRWIFFIILSPLFKLFGGFVEAWLISGAAHQADNHRPQVCFMFVFGIVDWIKPQGLRRERCYIGETQADFHPLADLFLTLKASDSPHIVFDQFFSCTPCICRRNGFGREFPRQIPCCWLPLTRARNPPRLPAAKAKTREAFKLSDW